MSDFMLAAQFFFNSGWAFLTSFNLPGVNFTPLAALFFSAFFILVFRFIRNVVGRLQDSYHGLGRGVSSPPPTK